MEAFLEREMMVPVSCCQEDKTMRFTSVFTLFQDMAGEHAASLGIGGLDLEKKGLFWLTVRTKIHFYQLPKLEDRIILRTWLGDEEERSVRSIRYYQMLSMDRTVLAEGKTEWGVFSFLKQQLVRIQEAGIPPLNRLKEKVLEGPFSRFASEFPDPHPTFEHRVLPSDTDVGHHMNNCAYMKALYDTYTVEESKELKVTEAEIVFRLPCLGDEKLKIHRLDQEDKAEFIVEKEDGKIAALARITKAN